MYFNKVKKKKSIDIFIKCFNSKIINALFFFYQILMCVVLLFGCAGDFCLIAKLLVQLPAI